MIARERYMRLIRDFMDKPVIKIITGMRRSGKSALLELTRQELLDRGVDRKNRSEERRVGKECLRLCRSRWAPYH